MLANFPENNNRKIWQKHFGASHLVGDFFLLHDSDLPRIAYVVDGDMNECTAYFADVSLFSEPPTWLVISNTSEIQILKYSQGGYSVFHGSLDWHEVKLCEPLKLTPECASIIVRAICKEHKHWLGNQLSKAAIGSIPRIFSECTTLVYELIQNAFDAHATSIKIGLDQNRLTFLHDGDNFTEADTNAISFVNLSNKDKDKTGFMGIGFKSVFEASMKPEIHSPPFSFLFDNTVEGGYILPQSISPKTIDPPFTTLISLPLKEKNVYDSIKKELTLEELTEDKIGFSRKTFLHLLREEDSVITGISKVQTPYVKFEIEKGGIPNSYLISDIKDGTKTNNKLWLYFEKKFKPNERQVRDFLENRGIENQELVEASWDETISIIVPIEEVDSVYSPVKGHEGTLNVYLPTRIKTGLSFDLQGNFVINAGREKLRHVAGDWNRALFSQIGDVVIKILEWGKFTNDQSQVDLSCFYSLIPNPA